MASGELLTRYKQGEHEEVWRELRAFDSVSGEILAEANDIAKETMKRVASNAELLAERLASRGWKSLYGSLRTAPQNEDAEVIAQIEEFTGEMLPISFRAFWEIVGGINFIWDYNSGEAPDIAGDLVMEDPLCIFSPQDVAEQIEEWEYQREDVAPEDWEPVELVLAPDYLHKANISGGDAYTISLPSKSVDPIFANEKHNLPFVDYLRLCFKFGGFPRLESYPYRTPETRDFLTEMTKDLQPF